MTVLFVNKKKKNLSNDLTNKLRKLCHFCAPFCLFATPCYVSLSLSFLFFFSEAVLISGKHKKKSWRPMKKGNKNHQKEERKKKTRNQFSKFLVKQTLK